jgi:hypothetical protein
LAAGNYSVHNFYVEVLNLLNVSADLVYPALNNVLLVSTGLGTAGLGLGLGLGHVGHGLGLGVGTVGLGLSVLVSADPVLITSLNPPARQTKNLPSLKRFVPAEIKERESFNGGSL